MKAVIVIPARYAAERFPGKLLAPLGGEPVIAHTIRAARRVTLALDVLVACDDPRIERAASDAGARTLRIDAPCASGTDRVALACAGLDVDVVVNLQGDEPFMDPAVVGELLACMEAESSLVSTVMTRCQSEDEAQSPHVVKVVCRADGNALYFSRARIPHPRRGAELPFKHLGLYAYQSSILRQLHHMPPSALERVEGLEQLRILEAGLPLRVIETQHHGFGIDTPEDLARAEALLTTHERTLRAD